MGLYRSCVFQYFVPMYFKCSMRRHPELKEVKGYYRLVESYRNIDNRIVHRTILNVGFMEDTTVEQRNKIQKYITLRFEKKLLIFEEPDPFVVILCAGLKCAMFG